MAKKSAGLLLFRRGGEGLEVLLVHPGGPFWAKKDEGAWSIPKGEFEDNEDPLHAARREFEEETGARPEGDFLLLTPLKQSGGKIVHAWAVQSDFDPSTLRSNTFSLHGREFPEVDRAAWFPLEEARRKILKGQAGFLEQLSQIAT